MVSKIALFMVCFIVATYSLSVVKTDSHMSYEQKHTKNVDLLNTAVEKATEEAVKYILQNPE